MSPTTKWLLIGLGCLAIVGVLSILGVCLLSVGVGIFAGKAIEEGITEDAKEQAKLFLSAAEQGEWDQARDRFDARLRDELSVEKLKALVEKDPDRFKSAELQLERDPSIDQGHRLGLKGTLRSKSGATFHARFVLVRTGKAQSTINPGGEEVRGQEGDESGFDPDFEWKLDEFEIRPEPF